MERQPRPPRYFTLDEANRLLPRVRDLIERLQRLAAEVAAIQRKMRDSGHRQSMTRATAVNGAQTNGSTGRDVYGALARADDLLEAMRLLVDELEEIGCEVKDVHTGLVDFRTRREGRAVYLCWRLGEDRIRYWHELDAGYAGRQPL
jgi:hypothetical protein